MPPLSPPLIDGVLRQGHKMLIAGPSKAGKSYALLELCCAIAEGKDWLGFRCAQGKVLYVNLELDRASCLHRLREVYERLGWQPENARLIDMWHLRGRSVPMDQLAPKLIRRAAKKQYIAVIFDPIYKVITGDENSADQMARFCNQFDKICTQLGCAVIYCHHHSKGLQGQKRSMDRASGSGVFARDPDALLDLIELDVTDGILQQERQKAVCRVYADRLERLHLTDRLSPSDALSESGLNRQCRKLLDPDDFDRLTADVRETEKAIRRLTAWRVEGTLREFPKFPPVNIWFDHPVHRVDTAGVLDGLEAESERPIWEKASDKRKEQAEKQKEKQSQAFADAFRQLAADGGNVEAAALAEALEVKAETLNAWLGDGKKSKENLKKDFEIFTGEDSKRYVRQVR
ncbi:MAG: AAA family ATPase, partial [Clostridia bacterium]|nr:AAA family ATPase [Clostridia bacterium]